MKVFPRAGETLSCRQTLVGPGGKGSNQAAAAAKGIADGGKVRFVGKLGADGHMGMFLAAYRSLGMSTGEVEVLSGQPTGQAYIMLDESKQNTILIALGCNLVWPASFPVPASLLSDPAVLAPFAPAPASASAAAAGALLSPLSAGTLSALRNAKAVLLQREIPDEINELAARVGQAAGAAVMLDMGGMEGPLPRSLLAHLTLLSLNETELSRAAGVASIVVSKKIPVGAAPASGAAAAAVAGSTVPFDTTELLSAAAKVLAQGVKMLLVTLGGDGALLVGLAPAAAAPAAVGAPAAVAAGGVGAPVVLAYQRAYPPPVLVDTTGAGDCFRANFAVAFVEGKGWGDCLSFAAAAAALCISKKGTLPSMPSRNEIVAFEASQRGGASK